jgi:NSS family neurotransmitter:Na+ symporter
VTKGTSLARAALIITGSILLVSLLATLTIFPLVFRYGMNPAQGPELVFDVLATVFAEMPGGRLMGTLFFVLLVFAALTPSVAGFEPVVAWLQQRRGVSRARAVTIAVSAAWLLGVGGVLSFSRWSGWHPLAWLPTFENRTFFDVMDFVPSNVLLPVGALATSVFVGWRVSRAIVHDELSETTPFARRWCVWALRYACPIAITAVFAAALW